MSLNIDENQVTAILLHDGWHRVAGLTLDSYELSDGPGDDDYATHRGGQSGICATGFEGRELLLDEKSNYTIDGGRIGGPLTSIIALRYERKGQ